MPQPMSHYEVIYAMQAEAKSNPALYAKAQAAARRANFEAQFIRIVRENNRNASDYLVKKHVSETIDLTVQHRLSTCPWFKNTCECLGIEYARSAILEYFNEKGPRTNRNASRLQF